MFGTYAALLAAIQAPSDDEAKRAALAQYLGRCVGYTNVVMVKFDADMLKLSEEMTLYWQLAERADPTVDVKTISANTQTAEHAASGNDIEKALTSAGEKLTKCRAFVTRNMERAKQKRAAGQ